MDNVINFPPKKEDRVLIWTCVACGCQSFFLHATGDTECVQCELMSNEGATDTQWRERLPEPPEEAQPLTVDNHIIRRQQSELILRSIAKSIVEEDVCGVFVFKENGVVRMWTQGASTEEQLAWYKDKIRLIESYIADTAKYYPVEDGH